MPPKNQDLPGITASAVSGIRSTAVQVSVAGQAGPRSGAAAPDAPEADLIAGVRAEPHLAGNAHEGIGVPDCIRGARSPVGALKKQPARPLAVRPGPPARPVQ